MYVYICIVYSVKRYDRSTCRSSRSKKQRFDEIARSRGTFCISRNNPIGGVYLETYIYSCSVTEFLTPFKILYFLVSIDFRNPIIIKLPRSDGVKKYNSFIDPIRIKYFSANVRTRLSIWFYDLDH